MRIALIALSGIRVCDQDLLDLGLTLPGFVERSKVIASLPSLGLLTLAGMTPRQHHVEYLEVPDIREMGDPGQILTGFDLVALSSYSAQIGEAYELADLCRERGIPVVMGGTHVSSLPEEAKAHCDSVVIGEGEVSWPAVLSDAGRGRMQDCYNPSRAEFDLRRSPIPAFHLLDIDRYNRLTVQTSRGCPHRCEFCASSILLTRRYKQKPMENILAEIDAIREIWKHPFIEFADDNTFVDAAFWKNLLPRLAERRIRWFTETDISVAWDADLLKLMRRSGCAQVLIGLESPEPAGLNGVEMKNNWKLRRLPYYKEAVRRIQSHGISVNGCFVLGLDGQGPSIFQELLEFVQDIALHEVQITLQTAFPGTPLYERLREEGRLLEERAWQTCTLFDVNYRPDGMSVDELVRGFRSLAERLYSDEFTRWRRTRFRELLREKSRSGRSMGGSGFGLARQPGHR
ncbi:MAG: B12-binding domain-containing radical SAM protein [bacterium]|nr:MAG: B12-binding domain-containing radical SAM protein [bacterium]